MADLFWGHSDMIQAFLKGADFGLVVKMKTFASLNDLKIARELSVRNLLVEGGLAAVLS